ncbi:hypothetical protein Dimus_021123 [Dionaea muscipula]
MYIDAIKEFYARLTLVHYKKKDIARSSVRGVDIEFDNLRLASILGVPGNSDICEYIKEVWEESKYTKPLEIIRKFANDSMITEARRIFEAFDIDLVGEEWTPTQGRISHAAVISSKISEKIAARQHARLQGGGAVDAPSVVPPPPAHVPAPVLARFLEATPAEDAQVNEEEAEAQPDFDWEAVVDEAALQGESGSNDQFYDAQVEVEEPVAEAPTVPVFPTSPEDSSNLQKEPATVGVDPSGPTGSIPDSVMIQLQADFERARANKIQADLEKSQAENARLLGLLQQAQSQPKP